MPVNMQGVLLKRGNIFKRFQNKYSFMLLDNILKFGKVGKEITNSIDLHEALVTKDDKKGTKVFKIKSPGVKLTLKAQDKAERDMWYTALTRIAKTYVGEDVSKRVNGSSFVIEDSKMMLSERKSSRIPKTMHPVTLN